jgi:hypothetical protein
MILVYNFALAQDGDKKTYTTSGGEFIFSWSDTKSNGADANTVLRFAPVFNIQTQVHHDFNDKSGFFTGLTVRNLGVIFDDPDQPNTRYKVRTYTLGVPLALKFGDMKARSFFAGYEIELPFAYKAKTFINEEKEDKFTDWFSKRTPNFYHSFFVGVQGPYGLQLKFKYYLTNFLDQDYAANDGSGNTIYPYQNLEVNVFYISLSAQLFKDAKMNFGN